MTNPRQSLQSRVRAAILDEWDPIGVRGIPEAVGEYNPYTGMITQLLNAGGTRDEVLDCLLAIETKYIGLPGNRPNADRFADRLIQLREEFRDTESE